MARNHLILAKKFSISRSDGAPHKARGHTVDQGVDLGAQSAARVPGRLVLAGFFGAGAMLVSTHNGAVDLRIFVVGVCGAMLKHPSQIPLLAQRLNRRWTLVPSPNRSGRSRHSMPVR